MISIQKTSINLIVMKIRNLLLLAIGIILVHSCSDKNVANSTFRYYDYEVLYNFQGKEVITEDKFRYKFSNDSLYFFIQSYFKNDTIEIKKNNTIVVNEVVDTESSTGLARDYVFGNIKRIKNIKIRINKGPWIYLDIHNKRYNLIGLKKNNSKCQVLFYKKTPRFY